MAKKMDAKQVAAWKTAHPDLKIPEDKLAACGPWPSLEVNDFLGYARGRDMYPKELVKFIEQLRDEIAFAYDGWTRTVLMSDPALLLRNMLDSATGSDQYNFTKQFILDFARNRALMVEDVVEEEAPPWMRAESNSVPAPLPTAQPEAPTTDAVVEETKKRA